MKFKERLARQNGLEMSSTEEGRATYSVEWKEEIEHLRLPARRTWFGSAFLGVWLIFWALGGGRMAITNSYDPMTAVWLIFWMFGLITAALVLCGQLAGVDVVRVRQGELVITRRAGPFARTWRYSTGLIRNLRVDSSKWTEEASDGTQWLFLMKQQWGSVRFDYGAETIHLAPHVDSPEAAQIAGWLLRRLPSAATC